MARSRILGITLGTLVVAASLAFAAGGANTSSGTSGGSGTTTTAPGTGGAPVPQGCNKFNPGVCSNTSCSKLQKIRQGIVGSDQSGCPANGVDGGASSSVLADIAKFGKAQGCTGSGFSNPAL